MEGEVLRWHHEHGKEVVPALQYIEHLEAEVAALKQQVWAQLPFGGGSGGSNAHATGFSPLTFSLLPCCQTGAGFTALAGFLAPKLNGRPGALAAACSPVPARLRQSSPGLVLFPLPQMEQQAAAFQRAAEGDARLRPVPGNELLDYLKCLTADELVQLTDCASEEVLDAMNAFVQRLMGEGLPGGL